MIQLLTVIALMSAATPSESDSLLRQIAETRSFNLGRPMAVTITPDEATVLFLRSPPKSSVNSLFAFDVATGRTREVLTPESVIAGAEETLSPQERARRERMRVSGRGFTSYALSEDGRKVLLTLSGKLYVVERDSGQVTQLGAGAGVIDPRFSTDGKQVAYVRDNDVFRVELATHNVERRVTRGGTPDRTHGLAEFVAQEEMGRFSGYWWSPDSKHIAYAEADTSGVETLHLFDPARPDQGAQPFAYPRPGKPNAKVRLFVVPVAGGPAKEIRWDAEKYPYMATVRWPKAGPLTVLVQNRAQTEELLLAADPRTGKTRQLLVERDDAWLQLDQSFPEWLEDGSGFLWFTERNGDSEVELRRADGSLVRSLVKPGAGFQTLVRYLPKEDLLYFLGGPNPTERYLWRVKGGGEPERVTSDGPALERAVVSSRGGSMVITTEGPTSLRRAYVHRADGTRLGELPSTAHEPPYQPRFELRQVGPERFWTALVRPRNFKPGVKLPVIVEIYGAAHPMVQQGMARHLTAQWMADHGFLVVKLDGRGTSLRGRAWERKLKFGFVDALDDQIAALQALAAEVPELDLTRVGIEGWSHGGFMSAFAVLSRPDVFKAAFAGAPVVDWRDYDSHLAERYLGLPEEHPEAYEKNSLLTYAKADKPIGKLLLVHGTFDDNVFFSHTLKLSDALLRVGKPHEVLPLSGSTHMLADPVVSERVWTRLMRHFQESL